MDAERRDGFGDKFGVAFANERWADQRARMGGGSPSLPSAFIPSPTSTLLLIMWEKIIYIPISC